MKRLFCKHTKRISALSRHIILAVLLCAFSFTAKSCDNSGTDAANNPKQALTEALTALNNGDIDTYMSHVDTTHMTSGSIRAYRMALSLNRQTLAAEMPALKSMNVIDVKTVNDSTVIAYYQHTYVGDSTEVMSQVMLRHNGQWLLRISD